MTLPKPRRVRRTTIPSKRLGVTLTLSDAAVEKLDRLYAEDARAARACRGMLWR